MLRGPKRQTGREPPSTDESHRIHGHARIRRADAGDAGRKISSRRRVHPARQTRRARTATDRLAGQALGRFAEHGLPVLQPRTLRDAAVQAQLAELKPDVIVVAAFGLLLPQPVLDLPPHGCINVHASLLPRYRGAAPIPAAILNGDAHTGITLMQAGRRDGHRPDHRASQSAHPTR